MKYYFYLVCSFFMLSCASTSSVQLLRFVPGDNINNEQYFAAVHKHFTSNNINIPEEQEREYTASIYIGTLPPLADVFLGTMFMGRANYVLYFKPGIITVTFKKNDISKTFTLEVKEGDNQGKFIKLI